MKNLIKTVSITGLIGLISVACGSKQVRIEKSFNNILDTCKANTSAVMRSYDKSILHRKFGFISEKRDGTLGVTMITNDMHDQLEMYLFICHPSGKLVLDSSEYIESDKYNVILQFFNERVIGRSYDELNDMRSKYVNDQRFYEAVWNGNI